MALEIAGQAEVATDQARWVCDNPLLRQPDKAMSIAAAQDPMIQQHVRATATAILGP